MGSWAILLAVTLGYERALDNPQIEGMATRYGYAVSQTSAFDSQDLMKAGLSITAQHDAFTITAFFGSFSPAHLGRHGIPKFWNRQI